MKFKFHSVVPTPRGNVLIVEYDAEEVWDACGARANFLWFDVSDFTQVGIEAGPVYGTLFQMPGDRVFHATALEAAAEAFQYST